MGMTLRRYHAARKEKFDKQQAIEEAKATTIYTVKEDVVIEAPVVEKRKYTKRVEFE